MVAQCLTTIYDIRPILNKHWDNVTCLMGGRCALTQHSSQITSDLTPLNCIVL